MNTRDVLKRYLARKLGRLLEEEISNRIDHALQIRAQLEDFYHGSPETRVTYWTKQFDAEALAERFRTAGIAVEDAKIDIDGFLKWKKLCERLDGFYSTHGDAHVEKMLEHYLTGTFLSISSGDVVLDIAAASSPYAEDLRSRGIKAYSQDLVYRKGVHDWKIGGDAGSEDLPSAFADVITLHCAFECFEGDADTRFARQIQRVLRSGGRLGIVPLYVDTRHFVATSPYCDRRKVRIEPEAIAVWREDKYKAPFSRHYSPETFITRVIAELPDSIGRSVLHFTNIAEVGAFFPGQRIYAHFMFKAVNKGNS